jgi:hypothetical protein
MSGYLVTDAPSHRFGPPLDLGWRAHDEAHDDALNELNEVLVPWQRSKTCLENAPTFRSAATKPSATDGSLSVSRRKEVPIDQQQPIPHSRSTPSAARVLSKVREVPNQLRSDYQTLVKGFSATIVMNGLGQACAMLQPIPFLVVATGTPFQFSFAPRVLLSITLNCSASSVLHCFER